MKHVARTLRYAVLLMGIVSCLATMADEASTVSPQTLGGTDDIPVINPQILSHANDYTFGYYPQGLRRKGQGSLQYAVQTNRYAFLFDSPRGRITHLGPITTPLSAEEGAMQGNELLSALPQATFSLAMVIDGTEYPATPGPLDAAQIRLERVGKYLQHFEVQTLRFGGDGASPGLEGYSGWLEAYCWPDHAAWMLHVTADESHLPGLATLRKETRACAVLNAPDTYPILEGLSTNDVWQPLDSVGATPRAVLMRNEQGAGIAFLPQPDSGCTMRGVKDKRVLIESPMLFRETTRTATFACIIMPSNAVAKDGLQAVRQLEAKVRGKITVQAEGIAPYTRKLDTSYDPARGWHTILLGESPDKDILERVRVHLANTDTQPQTIRLNFAKVGGSFSVTGMSPVLRDMTGEPIGLPIQISKNWHCNPPWFSGITMLELLPQQTLELEFDLAYSRWGGVPAVSHAQLCLLGYGGNQLWDEMAIGSFGESITYDPDVNLGRALVDDMRPLMVWGMGTTQKIKWSWTNNVGGCDFLTLFLKDQKDRQFLRRQKTLYNSYGPVLSNVVYAGETPDGAIQSKIRTQSWRSDDYVRGLYTLRYEVTKPLENIDRLAFFQLGADHYNAMAFKQIARGIRDACTEMWEPPMGGRTYSRRGELMEGRHPWIGTYGTSSVEGRPKDDTGALADKAMIIRSWKARFAGKECPLPAYSVYGSEDGPQKGAVVELSPPAGIERLEPGDYVEAQVEVLILPQKADDYYGPNEPFRAALRVQKDPWELTLREARGSDVTVTAHKGTVEQTWPVRVRANEGLSAEFTITGGVGYTPVTIVQAMTQKGFVLERINEKGEATRIDESTAGIGNDWWQTDFDTKSGTWNITYTLPLDPENAYGPQTFRWHSSGTK